VGVRATVLSGSRGALQQAVRETLQEVLARAEAAAGDLGAVLASGMITSAAGLHELPHLVAPAGAAELAAGMVCAAAPEICAPPIWWLPGVRNAAPASGLADIEAVDMMRGEETEAVALVDRLAWAGAALLVLPGSHTKFVRLDADGRIAACATTLAGELLQLLSTQSLLAASVGSAYADALDPAALEAGADAAARVGLARAAFGVRTLDLFGGADRNARACYLLGTVLASDLQTLDHGSALAGTGPALAVLVAGRPLVRDALCHLLRRRRGDGATVVAVSDAQQAHLAGWGACLLAHRRGLI
jgi:2-dehydro-3-deoxygalactonokinase